MRGFTGAPILMAAVITAACVAPKNPRLEMLGGDGTHFVLLRPLAYELTGTNETIVVPKGFVTDLTSIPGPLQSFLSPLGPYGVGAIVHDYLYWDQRCTQDQADRILHIAMSEYGVGYVKRNTIYGALYGGGWIAWDANADDRANGLPKIVPADRLDRIPANVSWDGLRAELHADGARPKPKEPGTPLYCALADKLYEGDGDPAA